MKKTKLFATLLGVGLAVGTPWQVFAQEQAAPQQAAAAQNAEPQQAAAAQNAEPPQAVSDGGVEAVREAQATAAPEPGQEEAASVLEKMMEKKGWVQGWDDAKKRFIAIGTAEFKVANPAKFKNLQARRRMAAMEAVLKAKAQIIQFLKQEMSAEQQVIVPGTDLNRAMNAEIENLMDQVNRQKEVVADLLAKKDKAEADKLRGVAFSDRLDELMVAAIKKLDKEYSGKEKDKVLAARYEEAVKAYKAEYAHYKELVKQAEGKRKNLVETQKSAVKSMAGMFLFGATAAMQTESWDPDGTYQVAVMVVWSNVLERAARAIATGSPFKVKKSSNNLTVHEWLRNQDLSSMIGPRQYIDKNGVRWFLGIASESVNRKLHPRTRNNNKTSARLYAAGEALLSVTSDLFAKQAAETLLNVYDAGKDADGNADFSENTASTLSNNLRAEARKIKIRGGQVLLDRTVKHRISGDDIYVVVYAFNPNHVADALAAWERNYATKTQALRYQTVERGRQAAVDDQVRKATNDPKDFQKGYQQQSKRFDKELQSRNPKKSPKGVQVYSKGTKTTAPAKSTAGTFSGDTDVSDDF